ncbi:MAG: hypothetical protein ACOVNR_07830, partial [Chitinophagaceae bacterium]
GCVSNGLNLTVNTVPAPPVAPTISIVQPTCSNIASITVTAPLGANLVYSINGTTYQASPTFSPVAAATTYNVTVRNTQTGCTSSATQAVISNITGAPAQPTITNIIQPTCIVTTGSFQITVPANPNLEIGVDGVYPANSIQTGLAVNRDYAVTVRDLTTGCVSLPRVVSINNIPANPAIPTGSLNRQPDCNNTTVTLTVNSPLGAQFEYALNGGTYQSSRIFTGLASGNYNVVVRNTQTGCISDPRLIVVDPLPANPAAATATVTQQPTCLVNGTITISAPLGSSLVYSIGGAYQASPQFTNLPPNDYTILVRNNSTGCISSPVVVTVDPIPNLPATPVATVSAQPTCTVPTGTIIVSQPTGSSIEYSVGGTYQLSGIFTGLAPNTTYSIRARDRNTGCISLPLQLPVLPIPVTPPAPRVNSPVDYC